MVTKRTIKENKKECKLFIQKYIWSDKRIDYFLSSLSPRDMYEIFIGMMRKGLTFTWLEEWESNELAGEKLIKSEGCKEND